LCLAKGDKLKAIERFKKPWCGRLIPQANQKLETLLKEQ